MGGNLLGQYANGQKIYVYEKNIDPRGLSAPAPGYIHVYDHNIQTSTLKLLGQLKPNFMWSIVRKGE